MKISNINILEYINQFKSREKLLITCDECEEDFYRTKKDIRDSLNKGSNKSFCSRICFGIHQTTSKIYNCASCNAEVIRSPGEIGNNIFCSRKCSSTYNNKYRIVEERNFTKDGINNIKKSSLLRKEKAIINYENNPKLCKYCNIILDYNKRKNTFCSYSCSAQRKRKRQNNNLSRKCKYIECNNIPLKRKSYCENCRFNYYKIYKPECCFEFNIYNYKDYITGFKYIEELGRYSPTNRGNNLNGASLDHMYSVKEGFINKVNLEIIKHPANCRIIPHSFNNSKNTNCYISYEELLDRIKEFDNMVDSALVSQAVC